MVPPDAPTPVGRVRPENGNTRDRMNPIPRSHRRRAAFGHARIFTTMAALTLVVMCLFGAVLGLILSAIPTRWISRTPYDLNQDVKFRIVLVAIAWAGIVTAATVGTALAFQWQPFFGALLAVGVAANLLADAVFGGGLPVGWAGSLRALYRNESYRYVPYEPSHGPFLDLFDPSTPRSITN